MFYLVDYDLDNNKKWILIVEGYKDSRWNTVIEILRDDNKLWRVGDTDYSTIDERDFVYEDENLERLKEYANLHIL